MARQDNNEDGIKIRVKGFLRVHDRDRGGGGESTAPEFVTVDVDPTQVGHQRRRGSLGTRRGAALVNAITATVVRERADKDEGKENDDPKLEYDGMIHIPIGSIVDAVEDRRRNEMKHSARNPVCTCGHGACKPGKPFMSYLYTDTINGLTAYVVIVGFPVLIAFIWWAALRSLP